MGLGVLSTVPIMLSRWADWARSDRGTRRVGIVHAAANSVGTVVFLASWAARARDQHRSGVRLARLGGVIIVVGGFLGGYMRSDRPRVD